MESIKLNLNKNYYFTNVSIDYIYDIQNQVNHNSKIYSECQLLLYGTNKDKVLLIFSKDRDAEET
jgi:hypothetical protein